MEPTILRSLFEDKDINFEVLVYPTTCSLTFWFYVDRVVFSLLASTHPVNWKHKLLILLFIYFSSAFVGLHFLSWFKGSNNWVNFLGNLISGCQATKDHNKDGTKDWRQRGSIQGCTSGGARRWLVLVQLSTPPSLCHSSCFLSCSFTILFPKVLSYKALLCPKNSYVCFYYDQL